MENRRTPPSIDLPPEVNQDKLIEEKGKFFLLPAKDRKAIIQKLSDQAYPDGRYEKKKTGKKSTSGQNIPSTITVQEILEKEKNLYPIIKLNNRFYAIADFIGKGSFGEAKLAQDLTSGEWFVIKVQETFVMALNDKLKEQDKTEKEKEVQQAITKSKEVNQLTEKTQKEINALEAIKRGSGTQKPITRIFEKSRKNKKNEMETVVQAQFIIVMKYIPGDTLGNLMASGALSTVEKFEIAAAFIDELLRLKNANYYHGDISPNNIKVDRNTMRVSLLDFGSSSPIASPIASPIVAQKGKRSLSPAHSLEDYEFDETNKPAEFPTPGTPGYRPREALARVTEKSEIYSAGLILAQLFGFLKMKNQYGVISQKWIDRDQIKDADLLSAYDFIKSMTIVASDEQVRKAVEKELPSQEEEGFPTTEEEFKLAMQREMERTMLETRIRIRVEREFSAARPNIEKADKKFHKLLENILKREEILVSVGKSRHSHFAHSPALERKILRSKSESSISEKKSSPKDLLKRVLRKQ